MGASTSNSAEQLLSCTRVPRMVSGISATRKTEGIRSHRTRSNRQGNQKYYFCGELSFRSILLTTIIIILVVVTVASWFIGASLATTDKDRLQRGKICSKTNHDPPNPITNENIYAWYLTTTGIFLFAFSFILCICGTSFIGLCCGNFPPIIKILSIGGCFITGAGVIVYIGWISVGTYLLSTISLDNTHEPLCKSMFTYLVVLYISLSAFLAACVVGCLWRSMENCKVKVDTFISKCRYFSDHKLVKSMDDHTVAV